MPVIDIDYFERDTEKRIADKYLHCKVSELSEKYIGRGRIGYVYETEYGGEKVAIKIVPVSAKKVKNGEKSLRNVYDSAKNEKKNISRLKDKSQYLVRYWDTEEYLYIDPETGEKLGFDYVTIMELLIPVTKLRLVKTDVDKLAINICEAIEAIHQKRIFHRDIGPKNIFYDEKKKIYKLGDYDVAKVIRDSLPAYSLVGDADTIAPEVWIGDGGDLRADIYSFGKTLSILYTRANTNEGLSKDDVYKGRSAVKSIIDKAMQERKEDRFQTAEEMLTALKKSINF